MSTYLQDVLSEATASRDNFVAQMAQDYSRGNLDRLQALQQQVDEAQTRFEQSIQSPSNGSNGSNGTAINIQPASAGTETNYEMCVVSFIRHGKTDRCREVRADATVADIVHSLNLEENGSWDLNKLTFKRRVGPGQTADITDPANTKLGPGTHEIWVGDKVAGGSR